MKQPDEAGASPPARVGAKDLRPEEMREALRVASELCAKEQAAAAQSEQQQAFVSAAEEAGLPSQYLDRAAAMIRARREQRGRYALWGFLAAVILAALILVTMFSTVLWRRGAPSGAATARIAGAPAGAAAPSFSYVNLRRARTHRMDEPMLGPDNDLSQLGSGEITLRGVPFQLDGLVMVGPGQTGSADTLYPVPRRVEGVRVASRADRLYFLHGAHFNPGNGMKIGAYVLHYADGSQVEIPIRSGIDVADWWSFPGQVASNAQVAWTGRNTASARWAATNGPPDLGLQLFMKAWRNPYPAREIRSLDVVSGDQPSGLGAPTLFLVGVSAARDQDRR